MSRQERIQAAIAAAVHPEILDIVDESHMHSRNRVETHFKVLVVSSQFEGQSRVVRQRSIQSLLQSEFNTGLHALSLRCLTPEEAQASGEFQSPLCQSKSR